MSSVNVNPRLRTLSEALELRKEDVEAALDVADSVYRDQEKTIFSSEGSSGGESWTPLSPNYEKWKKKAFPGRKILALSGAMRTAFSSSGAGHIAYVFKSSSWRIVMGATGPAYWKYHAEGGFVRGRPPKRDPQTRSSKDRSKLVEAVERGLLPRVMRGLRISVRVGAGGS